MSTVQTKQTNLREKLAELLDFRKMRDRLSGLGLYIGKDRTGTDENLLVRGGANVDDLQIGEIAALVGGTAVDVFVYDTSRDSDGGAWRKRTQHTSWYNEELNTATRGGRREFPAVAVIAAEADKVTIYDGDDPDLSMWMVFENGGNSKYLITRPATCITGINGNIYVGCSDGNNYGHLIYVNFISEIMERWSKQDGYTESYRSGSGVYNRNGTFQNIADVTTPNLVNKHINDVAMTILPNAPIDADTGLPVPTIAVATDGGVSVIKHDGTVVDYTCIYNANNKYSLINFIGDSKLLACSRDGKTYPTVFDIPSQDKVSFDSTDIVFAANPSDSSSAADIRVGNYSDYKASAVTKENIAMAGTGLIISNIDNVSGDQTADNVIISSSYNTGWMPGDIKLATLSDTTVETIGTDSSELVVDDSGNWVGNFDATTDLDSWDDQSVDAESVDSSNVDTDNNTITLTRLNNDGEQISKLLNLVEGQTYNLTFEITSATQDKGQIWIGTDLPSNNQPIGDTYTAEEILNTGNTLGVGLYSYVFKAKDVNYLTIRAGGEGTIEFKDISVRATTELITNGDFSTDVTASDGQTSGGWTSNKAELSIESGRLKIVDAGSGSAAYQAINTIAGKKYVLSLSGQFNDGSDGNIQVRDATFSGTELNSIDPVGLHETPIEFSLTFVAQSSTTIVRISPASTSSFTATFDNISVRPAVEDRSVNNNGLQIVGEINKTPVAPGADLVAYSGFSANNYLVQPYNEDLNFGTGDFCVMGWFKRNSNSEYHRIWNRVDSIDHHRVEFYAGATGNEVYFYTRDDSAYTVVEGTLPLGIWTYLVGVREGGTLKIYENGVLANSTTGEVRDLTSENNAVLKIGAASSSHSDAESIFDGSIALFRISATVPTDDQIAKIYRDEKVLFQDGAQATLYGTSDAVTALAYDEKTELLHVGTASGRSDFSGLRRINNTTTAITTSISAHNNLIAEQ